MMTETRKVRLYLHSETGTEGGWWATQDHEFIEPAPKIPADKICKTCGVLWRWETNPEPIPRFTYYRPEHKENGVIYAGGYFSSDVEIPGGQTKYGDEEDGSFNDVYTKTRNEKAKFCLENGHDWKFWEAHESWSYEGLRYLKSGDKLEILDADGNVTETIICDFISNGDQYARGAKHANGWVIHGYQNPETIDLDHWNELFMSEKTDALLTPAGE